MNENEIFVSILKKIHDRCNDGGAVAMPINAFKINSALIDYYLNTLADNGYIVITHWPNYTLEYGGRITVGITDKGIQAVMNNSIDIDDD